MALRYFLFKVNILFYLIFKYLDMKSKLIVIFLVWLAVFGFNYATFAQIQSDKFELMPFDNYKKIAFITDSGYYSIFLNRNFLNFFDYSHIVIDTIEPENRSFYYIGGIDESIFQANNQVLDSIDTLICYFNSNIRKLDGLDFQNYPNLTNRILQNENQQEVENVEKIFFYSYLLHLADIRPLCMEESINTIRLLQLPDNTYEMNNFNCVDIYISNEKVFAYKRSYLVEGLSSIRFDRGDTILINRRQNKRIIQAFEVFASDIPANYINNEIAPHSEFFIEYCNTNYHRNYIDGEVIWKNERLYENYQNSSVLDLYWILKFALN